MSWGLVFKTKGNTHFLISLLCCFLFHGLGNQVTRHYNYSYYTRAALLAPLFILGFWVRFPIFFKNSLLFTLLHSSHCRITLKSSINYLQFFCISIFHNFDSVCLQTLSQMGTYSIRIQHKLTWFCLLWHMDCSQWNEWPCSSLSVSICSNEHFQALSPLNTSKTYWSFGLLDFLM